MKTIITTSLLLLFNLSFLAQDQKLAVGKTTVDGDAIVDFGTEHGGMVLVPVTNVTSMTASASTIAFDGGTVLKSVKVYNGNGWIRF